MVGYLKDKISFIFKYLIGAALLAWLLHRFDLSRIVQALGELSLFTVGLIFVFSAVNLWVQFLRWRFLVRTYSASYDDRDLLPAFFAGFALRLMVPGGHAEISKIFLLPGKKSGKVMAFGWEKYLESLLKLFLVLIALPFAFDFSRWIALGAALILVVLLVLLPRLMRHRWLERFHEKEVNYQLVFRRIALYTSLMLICIMSQYYFLLTDHGSVEISVVVMAVIFIWGSGLLPISVSGLGVRENVAAYFLARHGVAAPLAAGGAFFIFAVNVLLPAVIGVVVILRRRRQLQAEGRRFKRQASVYIKKMKSKNKNPEANG